MASTLNGLECLGYRETEAGFEATLHNTTKDEILAINPATLDITADDGHVVETYRGFGAPRKITEDLTLAQFVVLFPWEDATARRVTAAEEQLQAQTIVTGSLEEESRRLADENRKLQAQLEAGLVSAQMLEDCLVEMADIVYA